MFSKFTPCRRWPSPVSAPASVWPRLPGPPDRYRTHAPWQGQDAEVHRQPGRRLRELVPGRRWSEGAQHVTKGLNGTLQLLELLRADGLVAVAFLRPSRGPRPGPSRRCSGRSCRRA